MKSPHAAIRNSKSLLIGLSVELAVLLHCGARATGTSFVQSNNQRTIARIKCAGNAQTAFTCDLVGRAPPINMVTKRPVEYQVICLPFVADHIRTHHPNSKV